MTKEEKEGEAGGDDDMEEDVTLGTERLRMRAKKRPSYTEDVPEGLDEDVLDSEEDGEDVPSDDFCSVCHQGGKLLCCDTCTSVYHLQCLDPPLKTVPKGKWSCPTCIDPLRDIEKILDCQMRPHGSPSASEEEQHDGHVNKTKPSVRQYLVKWRSKSYLHCSWIPEQEIENSAKSIQGLRAKFLNFKNKFEYSKDNLEDDPPIRTEWTTVDRIIDQRKNGEVKEYYVKWKELGYEESTWEVEEDIAEFQHQIDMYKAVMARGTKKAKRKGTALEGKEMKKRRKVFTAIESTPDCLKGGVLHPYQLEGLNFLRFAWQQEKHVILADEMGLGKTIQSIAFVASLAEEGVYLPHLVVAPLSTLRNWEREFATWAPQINTVMYVGHAAARALIRQYEFYYPKKMFLKKEKAKKKHGLINKTSKMDRIKFDVLLTSYEMINIDSATLKSIEWECLIVDEGHRLKNKDSKLFQTLRNYSTRHRVLLTGTPLQNNLDELFTLMHFLDASKFSSLEDFQQEFKDINQEEQVRRLHKILASHLLRRVKKDVMKDLPPKKELILRVELSPLQKEYYKAVLTRNYEVLSRHGGPMVSLNNVVMELRKICGHPFLLEGVEPVGKSEEVANRQRLEASGKLLLLDKMMVKLKAAGHRVLVYSQFQIMLDILEDWCLFKNWHYERIDGKITGAERQIRIDRFNAPNSSRFCFLLSTRAGGLGINLATADTVVIYDSDWNPHADLQAMARAHRLGQTNTVMIYRLVTRGTIEERMMQMTKKKMVLEHLVVGRMKTQVLNQEELDDILRYGAKELFSDDTDEASKAKQIRYDDAAIDRLLDRSQVGAADEMSIDDAEDNDVLKAFKVANFEYVDEEDAEMTKLQEAEREAEADRESEKMDALERSKYWENLLKEKYDQQKYELSQELGKGKRSRKQVSRYECAEDDLAGMGYVSSDEEDGEQETIAIDVSETNRSATEPITKKQQGKKRAKGPAPLMEGDERSLKVLGFSRKQRTRFVQILMRFGLGDFSWSQFTAHFKQKSLEEIKEYGTLFLTHIAEDLTHALTFSDGVPKEGLRIQDVLVRVAVLHLINNKVKLLSEDPSASLFSVGTYSKFSSLKTARVWNESHDWKLLRAIVKHGYGRWFEIIEDAEYDLHSVIRQELAAPQASAMQEPESVPSSENIQNGNISINGANRQQSVEPLMSNGEENRPIDVDLTSCREATEGQFLKREIDFMKKRTLLLERVLNAEYHLESLDEERAEDAPAANQNRSPENAAQADSGLGNQKPARQDDPPHFPILLAQDEISAAAVDDDAKRLEIARLYNQMCAVLSENRTDAIQTYAYNKSAGVRLRKSIRQLDYLCLELRKCLFAKPASVSAKDETNEHARPCTPIGGDDTFENESNIEATCDVENEDKIQKQKNGNSPRSQDDHVSHVSEQKNDASTQVSTDSQDDCYIVDNTNQNIRKSPVRTFHTNTWPQKIVVLDD